MIAVLDVSAAIEIVLQKENKDVFNTRISEISWVLAPDLFIPELTNVLWKYHRAKVITHEECLQYMEDGMHLVDDFMACSDLWKEALGEGIKNSHSIYDVYYAVLARRNDAVLLTMDASLAALCRKLNIAVCG